MGLSASFVFLSASPCVGGLFGHFRWPWGWLDSKLVGQIPPPAPAASIQSDALLCWFQPCSDLSIRIHSIFLSMTFWYASDLEKISMTIWRMFCDLRSVPSDLEAAFGAFDKESIPSKLIRMLSETVHSAINYHLLMKVIKLLASRVWASSIPSITKDLFTVFEDYLICILKQLDDLT